MTTESTPTPQRMKDSILRFSDGEEFARLLCGQRLEDIEVRTISFTHQSFCPTPSGEACSAAASGPPLILR
jgi:hypothetical protein